MDGWIEGFQDIELVGQKPVGWMDGWFDGRRWIARILEAGKSGENLEGS